MARLGNAQDIEPRRWSHLPVGSDFAGVAYAYTTGEIYFEPAFNIQDAQFDMQTIGVKYIHCFELFDKSARVDITQPYQIGHWDGLLNGAPAEVERDGLANSTLRFAVNLIGAPPLAGKEFVAYRAEKEDKETILGVGLGLQVPTGQYYDDKMINLGDNRFTFRPQIGIVHNRGKRSMELTTMASIYTDNNDFFNGKQLEQDPVYSADANLIYTFRPGLWLGGRRRLRVWRHNLGEWQAERQPPEQSGRGSRAGHSDQPRCRREARLHRNPYPGRYRTGLGQLHLRRLRDVVRSRQDLKMKTQPKIRTEQ